MHYSASLCNGPHFVIEKTDKVNIFNLSLLCKKKADANPPYPPYQGGIKRDPYQGGKEGSLSGGYEERLISGGWREAYQGWGWREVYQGGWSVLLSCGEGGSPPL